MIIDNVSSAGGGSKARKIREGQGEQGGGGGAPMIIVFATARPTETFHDGDE